MDPWRTVVQRRTAVHAHPIELVREENVRRREAAWIAVLYRHERRVFDSRWVSLELKTERGARWLVGLVRSAVEVGVFAAPKGANVAPTHRAPIAWTHDTPGKDDDCFCEHGPFGAHVENLEGPYGKGGRYYVSAYRRGPSDVGGDDLFDFHELVVHVEARSGDAGRFLAELAMDLATAGHAIPPIA